MPNVCVFGDSIVWGSWDPAGGGWVGRLWEAGCNQAGGPLAEHTTVYNCGVPGDRLHDLLERFKGEAGARNPDVIVVAIGINDAPTIAHRGTPATEFRNDYARLLDQSLAIGAATVVITPTNVDDRRPEHSARNSGIRVVVDLIQGCADSRNVRVIDVFGMMTPADLDPDGVHPSALGHEKLFRAIAPTVLSLPALQSG